MDLLREKMRCGPGGGRVNFGGDSESSSASTTSNTDKRLVVGENAWGASLDNASMSIKTAVSDSRAWNTTDNSVFSLSNDSSTNWSDSSKKTTNFTDNSSTSTSNTTNFLDGGAIAGAFGFSKDTTGKAFDSVNLANATLGDGYRALISASDKVFNSGQSMIGQTQQHVADAYANANTDAKGQIDNRTIMVIAAVAAVAWVASRKG